MKFDYFNKELLIFIYSTCQLFIGLLWTVSSMKSGKGVTCIVVKNSARLKYPIDTLQQKACPCNCKLSFIENVSILHNTFQKHYVADKKISWNFWLRLILQWWNLHGTFQFSFIVYLLFIHISTDIKTVLDPLQWCSVVYIDGSCAVVV